MRRGPVATPGSPRDKIAGTLRATTEEFERIELRAHALLHDAPMHDVWAVDRPGAHGGWDRVSYRQRRPVL